MADISIRAQEKKTIIIPFMKKDATKRNIPALRVPSQFNVDTGKLEPLTQASTITTYGSNVYQCLVGQEDLRQALILYRNRKLQPSLDVDIDRCSWHDVFAQLESARATDEKKTAGWKGSIRKLWGKIGENAEVSSQLLDTIPDEFGLSIVRAGLALCVQLAKRYVERRSMILAAFEDMPAIILRTQKLRNRFPENANLERHAISSYEALLSVMTDLVSHLLRPTDVKRIPFLSRRKVSVLGVDELLEKVTQEGRSLCIVTQDLWEDFFVTLRETNEDILDVTLQVYHNSEATKLQGQKINDSTTRIHEVDNSSTLETLTQDTRKSGKILQEINERTRVIELTADQLRDTCQARAMDYERVTRAVSNRAKQEGINAQNKFSDFLWDALQTIKSAAHQSQSRSQRSSSMMSREQLVQCLNIPLEHSAKDLENALRTGHEFDHASTSQANSLLRTLQFRKWSSPKRLAFLLVDGGMEPSGSERLSAMSFLCASLVAGLVGLHENIVCLHFFCGLHTFSGERMSGPNGMIRSLISQMAMELMRREALSLEFIDSRSFREGIERHSLEALCTTFHLLIGQLPLDTPLYCIIDGVSWFETSQTQQGLSYIIDRLRALVADDRLRPTFKLLATSPYRSRYVSKRVAIDEIVLLRPELAMDDAPTERMVMAETRRFHTDRCADSSTRKECDSSSDEEW